MSPTDLANVTGMKNGNIRKLLFMMGKAGEVRKSGRGRYLHPSKVTETPGNNGNEVTSGENPNKINGNSVVTDVTDVIATGKSGTPDKKVRNKVEEGRMLNEAEARESGIIRRLIDEMLERGDELTNDNLIEAIRNQRTPHRQIVDLENLKKSRSRP